MKSVRNVVILYGTDNLHLDAPDDIADGIIEIGSTFKRPYTNVNVFICGVLPSDCYWSINRVYIKDVNEILKLKCVWFSFSYVGQDDDWTLANGSLNPELFYSDKIHLVEKGNSKLSKSIRKIIEDFYDTGNINRYQLTKSYEMAVSFVLNADFPPLYTVSKLHSTSMNAFSDRHISNRTTVTPFSRTVLPISKNLAPEDKPVCQLLRNTSCNSEFAPIKRHVVNHVLCKSFLSLDPISVVFPVDIVNVNAKFTSLRSRVHVVKSQFRPLRVSVLKAPAIFTVNTVSLPNV